MQPINDNDSRFTPFSEKEFDRDPKERVAYYPSTEMRIFIDGRSAEGEPHVFSEAETRSVAEAAASFIEGCILASAETYFSGRLTFEVHLPPPAKSPWFIAWEREHGSLD
jgi:hypothetical protein